MLGGGTRRDPLKKGVQRAGVGLKGAPFDGQGHEEREGGLRGDCAVLAETKVQGVTDATHVEEEGLRDGGVPGQGRGVDWGRGRVKTCT